MPGWACVLAAHRVQVELAPDLPMVSLDVILRARIPVIEKALGVLIRLVRVIRNLEAIDSCIGQPFGKRVGIALGHAATSGFGGTSSASSRQGNTRSRPTS